MGTFRRQLRSTRILLVLVAPACFAACSSDPETPLADAGTADVVEASSDAAPDAIEEPTVDAGPSATAAGNLHFLQTGSVALTLKVIGDPDETVTLTKNGAFAFAGKHAAGSDYDVTSADPNCWIRNPKGKLPVSDLDVRCRVIGQSESTGNASTTSATYVDVPGIAAQKFSLDVPANVLIAFTAPQNRFEVNTNSVGHLAIAVDGVVTDEAIHEPTTKGFVFSVGMMTVRALAAGDHVVKLQFRSDTSSPPYLVGDTWNTHLSHKNLATVVLDSLQTFQGVTLAGMTTPFNATATTHAAQPLTGLSAKAASANAVVLAGLNVPDARVAVPTGTPPHSSGAVQLTVGGQLVAQNMTYFAPGRRRNASLAWADHTTSLANVTGDWSWFTQGSKDGTAGTMTLATGAPQLFVATFDPALEAPAPAVTNTLVSVGAFKSTDVSSVTVNLASAGKALVFADVFSGISYNAPGGNGIAAIKLGTTELQRAHWQSDNDAQGHLIASVVDLPAGSSTLKLVLTDLGGGSSTIVAGGPTLLQVLPLR
jgi:hypothetical protein